jgi:hypothetical protein
MGAPTFGFLFVDATSTGVEALGMSVLVAAFAFVENGQKALARPGRSAAIPAMTANAAMRNCWLNLIGKQRNAASLSNTRIAYIRCI